MMTKNEKKMLFIGIGSGVAVGLTGGYFIGRSVMKKKAREEIKRVRRSGYMQGVAQMEKERKNAYNQGIMDAQKEAEAVFNEFKQELANNPEALQKEFEGYISAVKDGMTTGTANVAEAEKTALEGQTEASEGQKSGSDEKDDEEEDPDRQQKDSEDNIPDEMNFIGVSREGDEFVFEAAAGKKLRYPVRLFLDRHGEFDTFFVRRKLKEYTKHDAAQLSVIWNRLGWGAYIPDPNDFRVEENEEFCMSEDEINNLELPIPDASNGIFDDEDMKTLGDEPEIKTMERERYLDEIQRYQEHPEEGPRIISRQEFEDDAYLDKRYFDYFALDNVFVEMTDSSQEVDPFELFGVVNGNELFDKRGTVDGDDTDPDIVHVKNFKMNSVIEVTRYNKTYQDLLDGSAFINGDSDEV